MSRKNLGWFAVKTLYLTQAQGKPSSKLRKDERKAVLFEERIVIHRARSLDSAIRLGEKEARAYSKSAYRNVYGQTVKTKYMGACDAFELFDSPKNGVEVFSSTQVLKSSPSRRKLLEEKLGKRISSDARLRRKFSNGEL